MMECSITNALTAVVALVVIAYLYSKYRHTYWRKRGVPHPPPTPFVGNWGSMMFGRKGFSASILEMTNQFRDLGYCGAYQWNTPMLLVFDPEMAKQIMCKDFSSFHDRGQPNNEEDPLSMHLFNLSGNKWRNLRNRLSPTFTSGKLKVMFPLMRDIGSELNVQMALEAKKKPGGEVDLGVLLSRYATDVIGSVAFGIQCNSLRDENAEFVRMSRNLFRQTPIQLVRLMLDTIHPKLGNLLPFKLIFSEVHNFFINLMKDTVEYREKNKVERNDFVNLMMQIRDAGLGHADPENHLELTPGVMAAQAFIFFIAGLDNVSNTVAFCLHRLAVDLELQQRVAAEVRDAIAQQDGELTYEGLKKMDLVDRVVLESLRLWSPIGVSIRKCNETTRVGDLTVEKGMAVMIVADTMHSNETIFPEPSRFDPDRHTAEAKSQRHPYAFLPFGEGPRICIAERFAMLEMKLAVAMLLRDFSFVPGESFELEPELDPKSFFPRPKNGFRLVAKLRE